MGGAVTPAKATNTEEMILDEHQWDYVLRSLRENVVLVKTLAILLKIAPLATVRPVETKAMIPGIWLAQSTNDYMDLVRIPYQNRLKISQPFYT